MMRNKAILDVQVELLSHQVIKGLSENKSLLNKTK